MEDENYFEVLTEEEARDFTAVAAAPTLFFSDSSGVVLNGTIKTIAPAPQQQTLWSIYLQNVQSIGNIQVFPEQIYTRNYFKFIPPSAPHAMKMRSGLTSLVFCMKSATAWISASSPLPRSDPDFLVTNGALKMSFSGCLSLLVPGKIPFS